MALLTRTSNPTFRNAVFTRAVPGEGAMTLGGTVGKSFVLLFLTLAATLYTWSRVHAGAAGDVGILFMTGVFGGFGVAILTITQPHLAPWTAPIYAVLEGLALGVLSEMYSVRYHGLPQEAVALTFVVFVVVLALYGLRIVRATGRVRSVIINATFAVAVYYLLDMVLWLSGARMPLVGAATVPGIVFTSVVACIAAGNLILDFDMIEEGIATGAPRYLEWYAGFALLVTLIWLYLEILRLMRKLRSR